MNWVAKEDEENVNEHKYLYCNNNLLWLRQAGKTAHHPVQIWGSCCSTLGQGKTFLLIWVMQQQLQSLYSDLKWWHRSQQPGTASSCPITGLGSSTSPGSWTHLLFPTTILPIALPPLPQNTSCPPPPCPLMPPRPLCSPDRGTCGSRGNSTIIERHNSIIGHNIV